MYPQIARIGLLLFFSGASALVYQIVWMRELRLIFGGSTTATAAVLAIFMGGLGLGGAVLGKKAQEVKNPLVFYATLEVMISLWAASTPFLLDLSRTAYAGLGGSPELGLAVATLARILFCLAVLGAPCFLMGGTLPAIARAVETGDDPGRRKLGLLYGINTLGAVAGVWLATFFLLENLGMRQSVWAACGVNLAVALLAWVLAVRGRRGEAETAPAAPAADSGPANLSIAPAWILGFAFVAGFCFFLMELVWYRMLAPVLGGTTFTFGLVLAMALLGIGAGGALYAALYRNKPATLWAFGLACGLEAFLIILPFAMGDRVAILAGTLRPLGLGLLGFPGHVFAWSLVAGLVVFPASVAAGFQFPLLIGLLGRGSDQVARQTGLAYAWNTAGSIAGSLAGGFGLLPLLTAPGCWQLAAGLITAMGLAATVLARGQGVFRRLSAAAFAAAALALLFFHGPTALWRHTPIGAGWVDIHKMSKNNLQAYANKVRRSTIWEAEGRECSLALENRNGGLIMVNNGKADASSRLDAPSQVMSGLLGAMLHPEVKDVLVVGLGSGTTAGWLAQVDSVRSVDVVEIEPKIQEVARKMALVNQNCLDNPKVSVIIGDGREVMAATKKKYDLIVSIPSNPYRAGIASLYTNEYFESVARALAPGGKFMLWVQGYDIDWQTVVTIYGTLARTFPVIDTWQIMTYDMVLVAGFDRMLIDTALLERRMAQPPYKEALARLWGCTDVEGIISRYAADPAFARHLAQNAEFKNWINTDDRMLIEYGFARTVGKTGLFSIPALRLEARSKKMGSPILRGPGVNPQLVSENQAMFFRLEDKRPKMKSRRGLLLRWNLAGFSDYYYQDHDGIVSAYERRFRDPQYPLELCVFGEGLAEAGDERALGLADQLSPHWPLAAHLVRGRYFWNTKQKEKALDAVGRAFKGYRTDPWPMPEVMNHGLDFLSRMATSSPETAKWAFELVSKPFCLFNLEIQRQETAIFLASLLGPQAHANELHKMEPFPIWGEKDLEKRARAYQAVDDPLAGVARAQWLEFLRNENPSVPPDFCKNGSCEVEGL